MLMALLSSSSAVSVPHPYARIYAKKDAKRRRIWNHALEKSVFSPLQLSTVGAQDRRPIYVASLEAHIDRLHAQLKALACYPVRDDQLAPYIGLHSKVAKSMVSSLQHDISQTNLKLLELERANAKLRESLGLPPKAPPLLVPSPPPRPRVPYTYPDLSAHINQPNQTISEPVPSYSQASTPASHFYSSANANSNGPIALPTLPMPEPSSLSFYYSSQPSSSSFPSSSTTSPSSPTDTCSSSGASAYAAPSPIYSAPTSPSSLADALSPVSPVHSTHSTHVSAPSPAYSTATTTQHNSPIDTTAEFSMLSQPYYPSPPPPSSAHHHVEVNTTEPPAYDDADAYRHEQHLMLAYPAVYLDPQPAPEQRSRYVMHGVAYVDVQQQQQQQQLHPMRQEEHVQQEGEWKHLQQEREQQRDEQQRVHAIRAPHPRFHPYRLPQQHHQEQAYAPHPHPPPSYSSYAPHPPYISTTFSQPEPQSYASQQQQQQGQRQHGQGQELYTFPDTDTASASVYPPPVSPSWTDAPDAYAPPHPHQAHQVYPGQFGHPGSSMHTTHGHGQYHYGSVQSVSVPLQAF